MQHSSENGKMQRHVENKMSAFVHRGANTDLSVRTGTHVV